MFVFIKTTSIIHSLVTNSLFINFIICKHYAFELITIILAIIYCCLSIGV